MHDHGRFNIGCKDSSTNTNQLMGAITLRKRRINATAISTHVENA
jgi:hypothetical protein